jgi:hypothetical protein
MKSGYSVTVLSGVENTPYWDVVGTTVGADVDGPAPSWARVSG